ncbi:hypothetical protein Tco_0818890 [Tanacetum coccineum]
MDDPNITMEEYIRLEEEKSRRCSKVYNGETATYGKIWYQYGVSWGMDTAYRLPIQSFRFYSNEDVIESCMSIPHLRLLYGVIQHLLSYVSIPSLGGCGNGPFVTFSGILEINDPNITMEEYIRLEEEKARRRVFNDALTSEVAHSCEPTVSPLSDNQIDFRILFDESDDEDYTIIYDKNSFSYNIISVNNMKMDSKNDNVKVNMPWFTSFEPTVSYFDDFDYFKDFEKEFPAIAYNDALTSKLDFSEPTGNDNDKIDVEHSSGDLSIEPLPNVIKLNTQGSKKLLETSFYTAYPEDLAGKN